MCFQGLYVFINKRYGECLWKFKVYGMFFVNQFGITLLIVFVLVSGSLNSETYATKIIQ